MLLLAVALSLGALTLLHHLDVPLGKPGKFVYLYSRFGAARLLVALDAVLIALIAGAGIWLATSDERRRRIGGLVLIAGALIGLAKELKCLGSCDSSCFAGGVVPPTCVELDTAQRRSQRLLELRKRIFKSIMLHEVGHNVGLRHNFEASYDALN